MDNLFHTHKEIEAFAELVALKVVALTRPQKDLISRAQAMREFGRSWVLQRTSDGLLNPRRSGSGPTCAILYSRAECAALLESERKIKATIKPQ